MGAVRLYRLARTEMLRAAFLGESVSQLRSTADVRALLVDDTYEYSEAHSFLDAIPAGARVGSAVALTNEAVTQAVLDADDVVFPSLTGDDVYGVILYDHAASEATSLLLAFIDKGVDFPVRPNGQNLTISWSNGANKILKLAEQQ